MSSGVFFEEALVALDEACSLSCKFCFRADIGGISMRLEDFARAASRLKELGIERVCFTGGEPLHHPKIVDLLKVSRQFGLAPSLVTASRRLGIVQKLKAHLRLLGHVTVSADSARICELGWSSRSVETAIEPLQELSAASTSLHVTVWNLQDSELTTIQHLVESTGCRAEFSPLFLSDALISQLGLSSNEVKEQYRRDLCILQAFGTVSPALHRIFRHYAGEERHAEPCGMRQLYVSPSCEIRRCPYDKSRGVSLYASRSEIKDAVNKFLTQPSNRLDACIAICDAECHSGG